MEKELSQKFFRLIQSETLQKKDQSETTVIAISYLGALAKAHRERRPFFVSSESFRALTRLIKMLAMSDKSYQLLHDETKVLRDILEKTIEMPAMKERAGHISSLEMLCSMLSGCCTNRFKGKAEGRFLEKDEYEVIFSSLYEVIKEMVEPTASAVVQNDPVLAVA